MGTIATCGEGGAIAFNGGGKTCRISGKGIYRALGVENIRHRRKANRSVVMRRLLSLDFVLEHPGMNWVCPNWLPTEGEKVEFIEGLGVHSNLIPRRIYYGAVRAQKRYFALKLPVAGGDKTVTFQLPILAYVDPGHATAVELNSWGAAHGPLWDAIRAKGRRVEVIAIGAELDAVLRAAIETDVIAFNGGGKTCRISGKGIYRALGVENIRHRRKANRSVVMRRLLSLDFVLEHPGLNWLQLWAAAEPGKVATGLTVKHRRGDQRRLVMQSTIET